MTGGLWRAIVVLVLILVVAASWWVLHRRRPVAWAPRVPRMSKEDLPEPPQPVAIVIFTSRFCAACREMVRTVNATAPEVPVIELPLHENKQAVARYGLVETPTLLLVDEKRRIRYCTLGPVDEAELWLYVREAWDSSSLVQQVVAQRTPSH